MALKALMLRKKIDAAKKDLETLRAKDADFEKREAELESAIDEAETDEETSTVESEVETFEKEKAEHEEAKAGLEKQVSDLEEELAKEEEEPAEAAGETEREDAKMHKVHERDATVATNKTLRGASAMEMRDVMQRDDVKAWVGEIREHISEKRDLTNVGLTIPQVFLGYLRENILRYSKLYRHVTVRAISGTGREIIMGSVPEGIWTECCGILNELDIAFNDAEVDCFKVGGYFKVCNSILEDSDLNLASELLDAIGQAIGLALDKAILYGRNTQRNQKMPLGVATRLVQSAVPSGYPATARPWVDLRSTNVRNIADSVTGLGLFQQLTIISGAAKGKYARGEKVWIMNETTYTYLKAQAMSINASGAIVSAMEGTMPVIGGIVEVLDFVPDYVIFGGYFELYVLAERAGTKFAQSEHAFFIQDQTAFKGTARYDGLPVIAEAFLMIGINGVTPTSDMPFAPDEANGAPIVSPTVSAQTGNMFEVPITSLQSGITVANGYITGTLKYLSGDNAITQVWGPGNFIALKFSDITQGDVVKVGIVPTQGSGMQALDDDKDALIKVTDKNTQVIKVVTSDGTKSKTDLYYLGGLTIETE